MNKHVRHNWEIKAPMVRLIDEDAQLVGVISIREARTKANQAGLDLVEVSPNANPPVCKILDYGKYCYALSKKEKEAKKKQKNLDLKEVKFSSKIGEHDYQTKLRNCERFLEKGHKVKVTMFFRGREKMHLDVGEVILDRICADLEAVATVEKRTRLVGSLITLFFVPK